VEKLSALSAYMPSFNICNWKAALLLGFDVNNGRDA
jgi:hypothetical protein